MGTLTLVPCYFLNNPGGWTVTGVPGLVTALRDASDASYVGNPAGSNDFTVALSSTLLTPTQAEIGVALPAAPTATWLALTSCTVARSAGVGTGNDGSLAITSTSSAGNVIASTNRAAGDAGRIAVTPGTVYEAYANVTDAYAGGALQNSGAFVGIDWFKADGTPASVSRVTGEIVELGAGGYKTISIWGQTAPPDAAFAAMLVGLNTMVSGQVAYADSMIFRSRLPARAQIRSLQATLRCSQAAGAQKLTTKMKLRGVSQTAALVQPTSVITSRAATVWSVTDDEAFLRYAVLGGNPSHGTELELNVLGESGDTDSRIHEISVAAVYNLAPVASAVTAVGYDNGNKPTVTWAYADAEGDLQERFRVKILTAAQVAALGGDLGAVDGSFSAYDSGVVLGSVLSHDTTTALVNGTTYTAYVAVGDAGSSGRMGQFAAGTTWLQATLLPAAPTVYSTGDAANARISLLLQDRDNLLDKATASFELGQGNWGTTAPAANSTIARSTAQFLSGVASLAVTSVAAGAMSARDVVGAPVFAGRVYTALASLRAAVSARSCRVHIDWYQADLVTLISTSTGASVADTAAGWTQVTLTAASPALAAYAKIRVEVLATGAAGEVHYIDQASVAPDYLTTWTRGGYSGGQSYLRVERSDDGGVTWAGVRGMDVIRPTAYDTTLYDYSAPPNTAVTYRAVKVGQEIVPPYYPAEATGPASFALTLAQAGFWLKDIDDPTRNVRLSVRGNLRSNKPEVQGRFRPLGRDRVVVLSDGLLGEEIQLPLNFFTQAAYQAFETLRGQRKTLLLQTDMAQQWWVRLGEGRDADLANSATRRSAPYRSVDVTATEVDAP